MIPPWMKEPEPEARRLWLGQQGSLPSRRQEREGPSPGAQKKRSRSSELKQALRSRSLEKGQALNQKQQFSMPISNEEIADFETHRETLIKNPVARGFIDAQEELHKIQSSVNQYVTKTMELGRVPQEEDFGSCGHGCGCHH